MNALTSAQSMLASASPLALAPITTRAAWEVLIAAHAAKKARADAYNRETAGPADNAARAGQIGDAEHAAVVAEQDRLDDEEYNALWEIIESRVPDHLALAEKIAFAEDAFGDSDEQRALTFAELAKDAHHLRQLAAEQAEPDAKLIETFRQWQAATTAYDAVPRIGDTPEDEAAWKLVSDAEDSIFSTPAAGPRGLAIKLAVHAITAEGRRCPTGDAGVFYLRPEDLDGEGQALLSVVRDAQRFVPEVQLYVEPGAVSQKRE